ncbi:MAG: agmatinase [Deltaproteobacteria bacterium]|nr:agmatinase [Deltaproteobacteria bacterium]
MPGTICVLGIPLDKNSSFRRGPALAPMRIMEQFHSDSTNLCAENGIDVGSVKGWCELGNMTLPEEGKEAFAAIERMVTKLLDQGCRVITLGGDHSITWPIVRAHTKFHDKLDILHFDAHPDLYDELEGNRYSHATPFARIMEEGAVNRLVQVGIRTMTPHLRDQAAKFNVEVMEMRDRNPETKIDLEGDIYLTLDLDCLDPAFAPGVSHHEPGGLTTRELLHIIHGIRGRIVGADIVELNPDRDWMGMTAMVAAKLTKEILAKMLHAGSGD